MTLLSNIASGIAAAVILMLVTPLVASVQQEPLAGLDEYIQEAVAAWGAPGLAGDVDVHTIFSNASTTKAFTPATLAMMVDEGKLD